ncbi:MAG: NUDIX domain-containing protein [Dissulfurimicrobium sp.]|uniref:NUDIX domain-containing protein n=1 Tax=Dissulfurimicrobium TaxID=1769732 RepID=UPI001EDC57A0|nr:NUDIX domain-containing protein [Dissulfurimicrobium hydrothermale]UKL13318.1 NUDIX domain-containing protein [Dissulfurimicrobium hydrothermale]
MQVKTLSAGVVVVRREEGIWKYLMLRAYKYWDFPKGIVEPGEEPVAAAIREVEEETTIKDLEFRWGYDYRETEPYNNGKVARYYIAETKSITVDLPLNSMIGRPEHDEYRWFTHEEALDVAAQRVTHVLKWAKDILG